MYEMKGPPAINRRRAARLTGYRANDSFWATLLRANGVVTGEHGAARLLGLHPQKLRSRIRALGLGR